MNTRAPQEIDVHIGQRLRQRRLEENMSQEQLAALAGVTFQQLQKRPGHFPGKADPIGHNKERQKKPDQQQRLQPPDSGQHKQKFKNNAHNHARQTQPGIRGNRQRIVSNFIQEQYNPDQRNQIAVTIFVLPPGIQRSGQGIAKNDPDCREKKPEQQYPAFSG